MASADDLNLSLTCAICLDVASADNAVETSCCHNLFCFTCIENVRPCPSCRTEDFQIVPAHFARRLIGNVTVSCPNDGCTAKVSRSNLAKHLANHCTYRLLTCPDPQCNGFRCGTQLFLEHLTVKHKQLLLNNFEKLWQKKEDVGSVARVPSDEKPKVLEDVPVASSSADDWYEMAPYYHDGHAHPRRESGGMPSRPRRDAKLEKYRQLYVHSRGAGVPPPWELWERIMHC